MTPYNPGKTTAVRSAWPATLLRGTPGAPVWQRNYYEHIIRNDLEWMHIRDYIAANPINWAKDKENPEIKKTHKSRYQEIENA